MRTRALQIKPGTLFDEWGPILHNGAQTWVGLDFQILQCTYHDLKILFKTIKPGPNDKIVDLGAGYGRMGIFLHWYYPNTNFLGLELVKERVIEANRIYKSLNCNKKLMIESDLSKLKELPEGDVYFIYDFGSEEHIKKILELLLLESSKILIVKGRICHNLIKKDPRFSEGFKIKNLDDVFLFYL
jgi:precorrin-6B methylase 2